MLKHTADGSYTLYSPVYRQSFHSERGALSEARHVFLEGATVAERLAQGPLALLEVGLGSGLNFLLTADLALACGGLLDYLALERELPPTWLLEQLDYRAHLAHPALFDAYLDFCASLPKAPALGCYRTQLADGVQLTLLLGEASGQPLLPQSADVIYQDAFSPNANPELWSETFLAKLVAALKPGGVLVSYTVSGAVRRRLARLGLAVRKRPGPPGGKREVLAALKPLAD